MGTDIKFTIEAPNLKEIRRRFEQRSANIKPEMFRATQEAVDFVWGKLGEYPPPPPNSPYRRTGELGRSIYGEVRTLNSGPVGVIGTNLKYAPYVIDQKNQAWMHKGRWWTIQGKIKQYRTEIDDFFRRGFLRALGLGG